MPTRFLRAIPFVAAILWVVGSRTTEAQDELFVANTSAVSVMVYTRTASGNLAPLRTISGAATGLLGPPGSGRRHGQQRGVLLVAGSGTAWAQDEIFVTNEGDDSVTVYTRTANGNVAPLRTIRGGATGLNFPAGVAVDTVNGELVVANRIGNSITVYAQTANGNVAPIRTISGLATGLDVPGGVAWDIVNNELVVVPAGPELLFLTEAP